MKKLLNLILIILLITGCTVEYNIKITNDFIDETTSILNYEKDKWDNNMYLYNGEKYKDMINEQLKTPAPVYKDSNINPYDPYNKVDGVEYYDQTLISNTDVYGIRYKYKIPIDKYNNSINARMCYSDFDIVYNQQYINISTSEEFKCFNYYDMLDKIEVNVTTSWDYEIVSSNADKEEDGKYTWIITKENASNKPIEISVKKVFNWRLILIIIVPILLVSTIIYIGLRKKLSKNNQI